MKILILCDVLFPQTVGGAGRVARELGAAWRRMGDQVHFLTRATAVDQRRSEPGISYLPSFERGVPSRFRRIFQDTVAVFQPDIVHVHQPLPAYLSIPRSYIRPFVYTFHSSWPEELKIKSSIWPLAVRQVFAPLLAQVEKRVLSRAREVTVLSQFSAREVARLYNRKAVILPGGVASERFRPVGEPASGDAVQLITLRNLVPRMGLRQLVQAVKLLPPHVHLDIGGEGPLRAELERLVESLGLGSRVRLRGHIPDNALPEFYSRGHWFVLPTRSLEGFGLVILESLSCGTPVLGTRIGAIPELLERFDANWLIEQPTPEAIAEAVRSALLRTAPGRQELHDRVAAEFDWQTIARWYRDLFVKLL